MINSLEEYAAIPPKVSKASLKAQECGLIYLPDKKASALEVRIGKKLEACIYGKVASDGLE
jgi:hypothetical protein